MKFRTYNEAYTSCVLEEIIRQGVGAFFIAPGSRSSPLVLSVEAICKRHPEIMIQTHYDERGLGFLALGYSKASQKPSVVITTSGSAVANLLPALVEAQQSNTPIILLTADRPFELLNNGANQAISQTSIFKDFVCDEVNIHEVSAKSNPQALISKIGFSVYKSLSLKKPIHINWHFQEPLCPIEETETVSISDHILQWMESNHPWTQFNCKLTTTPKTVICAGGFLSFSDQNTILKIAEKINAPIFWDVQNTFRFQVHRLNILNFDIILDKINPEADMILHFGGSLTSKRLNQWIEKSTATYVRIHPELENRDFLNKQKIMLQTSYDNILESIEFSQNNKSELLATFIKESETLSSLFETQFTKLSEMTLPYHLLSSTTDCNLFVGSSMPIRDLERFSKTGNIRLYSNRGASGIDGNIASAVGIALSTQIQTIVYIGDLTLLYDLNSLTLLQNISTPIKILVVNNNGGGIFSFLPISKIQKETFDKYFQCPHSIRFKECASFFGIQYFSLKTLNDLNEALNHNGHCLMELHSNTENNVKEHRELTQKYLDISSI